MKKDFYVYLSSKDNINLFPNNLPFIFESYLGEYISFETGNWQVGLKEINFDIEFDNILPNPLCICSDICDTSFFHGKKLGILREIFHTDTTESKTYKERLIYDTPIYLPLISKTINSFKINIQDKNTEIISGVRGIVNLTLHFRKVIW